MLRDLQSATAAVHLRCSLTPVFFSVQYFSVFFSIFRISIFQYSKFQDFFGIFRISIFESRCLASVVLLSLLLWLDLMCTAHSNIVISQ